MKALLSNDDGYVAEGLLQLQRICQPHFSELFVVAPDRNCSGASSSLTLRKPLYTHQHSNGFYSVEGTPTDCVHLALSGLLDHEVDIVIAGINLGANLGDDTIYSGTVAAAIEGRFLGFPSLAISLTSANPKHYDTAEWVINQVLCRLKARPLAKELILNINIPDIALADLRGIQSTRLGCRSHSGPVGKLQDKHGQTIYQIGSPGQVADGGEGTDFAAIAAGFASITPLQIDLTRQQAVLTVADWLNCEL